MNDAQDDFTDMKIITKNSANYFKKYSEKNNIFEIYNYQNYYLNNFQLTMKDYKKLSEKNSSTACYVCDMNFLSNNKLYQHLVNCAKIIQSEQSLSDTNNSQIIEFIVTNKIISNNYVFKF